MRLIGYELKKLIQSPLTMVLVTLTIALNVFVIVQEADHQGEITSIISNVATEHGQQMDEDFLARFNDMYVQEVNELNAYTEDQFGASLDSPLQYMNDMAWDEERAWEEESLDALHETAILESILLRLEESDESYQDLDQEIFMETYASQFGLEEDSHGERLGSIYSGLDQRLDTVIAEGEHQTLFFGGEHGVHSLLYRTLLRNSLIALGVIITLMTSLIVNYEFERRTELHTYATKRGRLLLRDKWWATMIGSTVVSALIVGLTLIAFFTAFPYSGLWESSVSSYFNWEYELPYIGWWSFSMGEFLIIAIAVAFVLQFIVANVAFILSVFIGNSYVVFFVMLIFAGTLLILPGFVPTESVLIFVTHYTPFTLMMNPHHWLMISHPFISFQYYEVITLGLWLLFGLIATLWAMRRFQKQAI